MGSSVLSAILSCYVDGGGRAVAEWGGRARQGWKQDGDKAVSSDDPTDNPQRAG